MQGDEDSIKILQERYKLTNNEYSLEATIRTPRGDRDLFTSFRLEEIRRFYKDEIQKSEWKIKNEGRKKRIEEEKIERNQMAFLINKVKETIEEEKRKEIWHEKIASEFNNLPHIKKDIP